MRTIVSILFLLSAIILFSACNSGDDDSGSSGGTIPRVSFKMVNDTVICYNADRNTINGSYQTCEWFCALYDTFSNPANWIVTFDTAPQLTDPTTTADYTYSVHNPLPCK